jgi:hypothetical protein
MRKKEKRAINARLTPDIWSTGTPNVLYSDRRLTVQVEFVGKNVELSVAITQ